MSALFFPAGIWLDNNPLTDQGRSPVEVSRDERSVTVELSNGTRKRYIKAIKHKFTMSWSWLPDDSHDTIDGGYAHTKIAELVGESEGTHLLRFNDRNGHWTDYNVFVNSYSESLIRRDPHSGTHFWNVSIELEEQ